jgi:hypothetical protein
VSARLSRAIRGTGGRRARARTRRRAAESAVALNPARRRVSGARAIPNTQPRGAIRQPSPDAGPSRAFAEARGFTPATRRRWSRPSNTRSLDGIRHALKFAGAGALSRNRMLEMRNPSRGCQADIRILKLPS